MRKKKFILSMVLLLCIKLSQLQAQEAVLSTGAEAVGAGASVSYSVGQVVYTTNTGSNGTVAQGVQQPYEISVLTEIGSASGFGLSVFPNPTTDFLTLDVGSFQKDALTYELYDVNGKLLENIKINEGETVIPMNKNASGIYFLKVIERSNELKTFKIIKN